VAAVAALAVLTGLALVLTEHLPGTDPPTAGTTGPARTARDARPADPPPTTTAEPAPTFAELMDAPADIAPGLRGTGTLVPVPGSDPPADPDARVLLRYRVDVEEGLPVDPAFFAEAVHRTLSDPRSWGNAGERAFARVSSGDYDFVITLASPGTTAEWCARSGLDVTVTNVSCDSAFTERIMINGWRWAHGSETYGDALREYRQMLINHEVGHRIGYNHADCTTEGAPAPVMMQQTKFLTSALTGLTCLPNPWPHPDAGSTPRD
jgi:hypothetical protein